MKKITSFLLMFALIAAFVAPAKSFDFRTVKKETVKSETLKTLKVVAEVVKVKSAFELQTLNVEKKIEILKTAEVIYPPGLKTAPANYARTTDYKKIDALIKPDKNLIFNPGTHNRRTV